MSTTLANSETKQYLEAVGYSPNSKVSDKNKSFFQRCKNHNITPGKLNTFDNTKDSKSKYKSYCTNKENRNQYFKELLQFDKSNIIQRNNNLKTAKAINSVDINEFNDDLKPIANPINNLSKMSTSAFRDKMTKGVQQSYKFMDYNPSSLTEEEMDALFNRPENDYITNPSHPHWSKRVSYDPKLENPNYAAYYANKIGGKAYRGDFNDDDVDDIIIATKTGKIKTVNGHTIHKSNRGIDLQYYGSDAYAKAPHKTKSGRLDVLSKDGKKAWITSLDDATKNEANKTLKAAGMNTFVVKKIKATKAINENAKIVYDTVIKQLESAYPNLKGKLRSKLSSATFASRINNAILLALGGALDKDIKPSNLDFILTKLRSEFNKEGNKQKVLDLANEVLESLVNVVEEDDEFAKAVYQLAGKGHTIQNYKALANILLKAKEIAGDDVYKGAIYNGNELIKRPSKPGKPRAKKATAKKPTKKDLEAEIAALKALLNQQQ